MVVRVLENCLASRYNMTNIVHGYVAFEHPRQRVRAKYQLPVGHDRSLIDRVARVVT
jgi:hypothetical protein